MDPVVLENATREPLSWQEIADALTIPSSPVAQHILGTANFMTAAICMVTNQMPGNVCQIAVIQHIESVMPRAPSTMTIPRHMFTSPDRLVFPPFPWYALEHNQVPDGGAKLRC